MDFSDQELDVFDAVFYSDYIVNQFIKDDDEIKVFKRIQTCYKHMREDEYSKLPVCIGSDDITIDDINIDTILYEINIDYSMECDGIYRNMISFTRLDISTYYKNKGKLNDDIRYAFETVLGDAFCRNSLEETSENIYESLFSKLGTISYKKFLSLASSLSKFTVRDKPHDIVFCCQDKNVIYIKVSDYLCYKLQIFDMPSISADISMSRDKSLVYIIFTTSYEYRDVLLYDENVLRCQEGIIVEVGKSFNREILLNGCIPFSNI